MSASHQFQIPRDPVARGAQGSVYFATHPDGRQVAIKVAASSQSAAEALEREAALLRAAEDAGIDGVVRCLERIEVDGQPAMVMPRYSTHLGVWLKRTIGEPDASSLDEVLARTAELARILGEVHQVDFEGRTLVHRDVKPENVFVDAEGRLKLGDFGAAMTIDGLRELEIALYGTPLWAPFDQVLPGRAIPDPTWDTYAVCVLLYAGLTGARPAYQADPRELLTPEGRELWGLAQRAIAAKPPVQQELRRAFAEERVGASATDLVDLTGRGALNEADRAALQAGLDRLGDLAGTEPQVRSLLLRGLWGVLVRGLSPVSHPSPPNRFRDGRELAELLGDLRALVLSTGTPAPGSRLDQLLTGPMDAPDIHIHATDEPSPPAQIRRHFPWLAVISIVAILVIGAWFVPRMTLPLHLVTWGQTWVPGGEVTVEGRAVQVDPFQVDRVEVTRARWARCVEAGACPALASDGPGRLPATGIGLEEARAYCAFAGARLPTEAEWRLAAGGSTWPWGDAEPTCDHAWALGCGAGPAQVGRRVDGLSAEGVHDLAGNAWEWVVTADGQGALLGGGATSPASQLGTSGRLVPEPGERPALAGVRCVVGS